MPQKKIWEKEYEDPKLVAKGVASQNAVRVFLKWLRKDHSWRPVGKRVLDLGSGNGRNSNYLASLAADVVGIELSERAIETARGLGEDVTYIQGSFGEPLSLENNSVDLALDIMSSNSLNEKERGMYIEETGRVLKPNGFFLVKALCKDGDTHAKKLLKDHPGKEYDTYEMPDMGLVERIFSKRDFVDMYSKHFEILKLEKKTSYPRFDGRIYKRNFWIAYMRVKK